MKIKCQLEWTDYLNSQLLHMQPSRRAKKILYGVLGVMVCGFIGGFFLFAAGQLELLRDLSLSCFGVAIFVPLYVLYLRYIFLPKRVKKIFFQQKELSSPFEIEFTDTSMLASNEFGNSTRPWKNFIKWKENKKLLLLYHSDMLYNIIPKRFFFDPQQIETVKTYLETNKVPCQVV